MTQLVKLDERAKGVEQLFRANMPALVKAAPKASGDPTRLVRMAFNAIAYNPGLVQCSHASLLAGVMESMKLGLTVGGPLQECFLIPFRNKGEMEATFILGYQGMRSLIDRSKAVMALHPRAVYQNDAFDVDFGSQPRVSHKPYWMLGHAEPGPLVAVYAVAHLRGGGIQIEVMPKAEIDAHRARSRAGQSGPWVTDYDAMALKTVVRKIFKYLPKAGEIHEAISRAVQLDERADRGESQYAETDLTGMQVFDEGPSPASATKPLGKPKALDALKPAPAGKVLRNDVPVAQEQAEDDVSGWVLSDEDKRLDAEIAAKEAAGTK